MAWRYLSGIRLLVPSDGMDRRTLVPRPGTGYQTVAIKHDREQQRQRKDDDLWSVADKGDRTHVVGSQLHPGDLASSIQSPLIPRVGFVCLTTLIHHYFISHLHNLLTGAHPHLPIIRMSHLLILVINTLPYSTLVWGDDIGIQGDDLEDEFEHVEGEGEEDVDIESGGKIAEVCPPSSGNRPVREKGVGVLRDTARSVMGFVRQSQPLSGRRTELTYITEVSLAEVILSVGFHRHLFQLLVMIQSFLWILEHLVTEEFSEVQQDGLGCYGFGMADARDLGGYHSLLEVCILIYLIY
ncbi:hypothetical protein M9H77_12242 [Catharanthus roseus]|uniref:Uncharacterized protein n=1 Tax=Catharanthus roseus TaxID=4058 RepID=A0ACC0BH13_CATRO|nr:hypothetical protein M9H77_12242 [Catharanthus roseus]